mmetsp:Transcript_20126/g.51547  ORF Transcript_20126/g.51547 Transcript_20126/m.51547 type:complete len:218 (+) Transcript_20126:143-796(+)|eukprot:jgi/Tetstr1/431587/TSEL_021118.t1
MARSHNTFVAPLALLLLFATSFAHSRELLQSPAFTVDQSKVTFGGSGCPSGTVQVVASPDGQTLSVLFDEYSAATQGRDTRDRKSCNLALPVSVPNGISLGIFEVDYRGFVFVPNEDGASARMTAEYFWAGQRGPTRRSEFPPGFDDDFTLSDTLTGSAVVFSPCGQDVNFRINTSIEARKARNGNDAEIAVDTTDIRVSGQQLVPFFTARFVARFC